MAQAATDRPLTLCSFAAPFIMHAVLGLLLSLFGPMISDVVIVFKESKLSPLYFLLLGYCHGMEKIGYF